MDGTAHLAGVISAHLREWEPSPAFVELAIFDSDDALAIARAIDAFCSAALGAGVTHGLFHQSSIGSVTGVALADGRRVVIKAHQPERSRAFLAEVARVQTHLTARGLYAPTILAGPLPLGRGHGIVEDYVEIGAMADSRRPENRRALARALRAIVVACEPLVAGTSLPPMGLFSGARALWPKPHSKLFDFAATARGAEWIDAIAVRARAHMTPAGARVIGHSDWRQDQVRFLAGEPVAAFDWDSLCCELEPALLGAVAHAFCADWSPSGHGRAPTLAEALAFLGDYEAARGCPFSAEERQLAHACLVYACAYTARCGHVPGKDQRGDVGTFHHLLWNEAAALLHI